MKTTKLMVTLNGVPVEGAKLLVGTLTNAWRISDAAGEVSFKTADDFVSVVPIVVRNSGAGKDIYVIKAVESGDTVTVNISKPVTIH
uniref:Uncharacterized protein n=1 Tax=viral metagenome TaxID=1070528 RepID=A0A6M3KDT4_9ZZZZ